MSLLETIWVLESSHHYVCLWIVEFVINDIFPEDIAGFDKNLLRWICRERDAYCFVKMRRDHPFCMNGFPPDLICYF